MWYQMSAIHTVNWTGHTNCVVILTGGMETNAAGAQHKCQCRKMVLLCPRHEDIKCGEHTNTRERRPLIANGPDKGRSQGKRISRAGTKEQRCDAYYCFGWET